MQTKPNCAVLQGRGRFGGSQYIHDPDFDGRIAGGELELRKSDAVNGTVVEIIPASSLEPDLIEDICEQIKWKW